MDQKLQEPSGQLVRKKTEFSRLSADGKWKSFEKAPNLLQYVPSGVYYARVKIQGKLFRESLETKVWTTAKLKLADFVKSKREQRHSPDAAPYPGLLMSHAVEIFQGHLAQDISMKESSKEYRRLCLRKLKTSWPELWSKTVVHVSADDCRDWATRLSKEIASQYFNNVVGTLQMVLQVAVDEFNQRGGRKIMNPAADLGKARVLPRLLRLPEPSQFRELIANIRKNNSWGKAASELIEFLAYSGARLYTEAQWITWEDVDWTKREIVVRGHPDTRTKNWEARRIPILPNMDELLNRLRADRAAPVTGTILRIIECPVTLKKACRDTGLVPLRHHDLRHLFATRCIESGVDIPTVARWLGHKDGGALAMRTYGHLRNEHSQAMAAKVQF